MHAADTFFDGLAIWAVFAFLLALGQMSDVSPFLYYRF